MQDTLIDEARAHAQQRLLANGSEIGLVGSSQAYRQVWALYPPIRPGEPDWRDYYRVRNLNMPHHYHNGGAWPFIGGFYVAALVQAGRHDEARRELAGGRNGSAQAR
jgi:hypothetical protein